MSKRKSKVETSKRPNEAAPAPAPNPQSEIRNPQSEEDDGLPVFTPTETEDSMSSRGIQKVPVIRCPECNSKRVHQNGAGVERLYYKCMASTGWGKVCGERFKVWNPDPRKKKDEGGRQKTEDGRQKEEG